jgi:hypothetical protein
VFAYGQTGSGKTHTIFGREDDRGLLPRSLIHIFERIEEEHRSTEYLVKVSFLEIYNETVMDLIDPSGPSLSVREDLKKGIYVEGLA